MARRKQKNYHIEVAKRAIAICFVELKSTHACWLDGKVILSASAQYKHINLILQKKRVKENPIEDSCTLFIANFLDIRFAFHTAENMYMLFRLGGNHQSKCFTQSAAIDLTNHQEKKYFRIVIYS